MKKLRLKYASSLFLAFALCAPSASINAGPLKKGWQVLLTAIIAYTANSSPEFTTNRKPIDGNSILGYSAIESATRRGLASVDSYPSKMEIAKEVADQLFISQDQGLFDHLNPLENKGFVSTKKAESHKKSTEKAFRRFVASEGSIQGYPAIQTMVHNKVQPQFYFSKVEIAKDFASMLIDGLDIDEAIKMGISPYELFTAEFPQVNSAQHRRLQVNTTFTPNATLNGTTTTLAMNTTANTTTSTTEDDSSSDDFIDDLGGDNRDENIAIFTAIVVSSCIFLTCLKGGMVWIGKEGLCGNGCQSCCNRYFVCQIWNDCCNKISCGKCVGCNTFWDALTCGACTSCCVCCCMYCPKDCKKAFGCERCYKGETTDETTGETTGETTEQPDTGNQIEELEVNTGSMTAHVNHKNRKTRYGIPKGQHS